MHKKVESDKPLFKKKKRRETHTHTHTHTHMQLDTSYILIYKTFSSKNMS